MGARLEGGSEMKVVLPSGSLHLDGMKSTLLIRIDREERGDVDLCCWNIWSWLHQQCFMSLLSWTHLVWLD